MHIFAFLVDSFIFSSSFIQVYLWHVNNDIMRIARDLKSIQRLKQVEHEKILWIDFESFISFLKDNHSEGDKYTTVRADNIRTELKRCVDSLISLEGINVISFEAFIRFVFRHTDDYCICKAVATEITNHLTQQTATCKSIEDLYKEIAAWDFTSSQLEDKLLGCVTCDNIIISTLHEEYRQYFSDDKWKKIQWFEWHFCQFRSTTSNRDQYEQLTEDKWTFFQKCKDAKSFGGVTNGECVKTLKVVKSRRETAKALTGQNFELNNVLHSHSYIENTIVEYLLQIFNVPVTSHVACVCCDDNTFPHQNGVHIY